MEAKLQIFTAMKIQVVVFWVLIKGKIKVELSFASCS